VNDESLEGWPSGLRQRS